jgi:DNA-directed RNA polymerase specialized sigma24 family protein
MSEKAFNRKFPTTQWSVILGLQSNDAAVAQSTLEYVFERYRHPLYAYLCFRGFAHQDAEDVLQGFFEKLLRNEGLRKADSSLGRLRSFLLTSLNRFAINWQRNEARHKMDVPLVSRQESADWGIGYREPAAVDHDYGVWFDRHWARELVFIAKQSLRAKFQRRGREPLYEVLEPLLVAPGEIKGEVLVKAAALGLSAETLRVALHRMRREFKQVILAEVTATIGEEEDPAEELRYLLNVFAANETQHLPAKDS